MGGEPSNEHKSPLAMLREQVGVVLAQQATRAASNRIGAAADQAQAAATLKMIEPLIEYGMITYETPSPAAGNDRDTSRLTFHVPAENTIVSLGAQNDGPHKVDPGVFIRTDNHMHLEVTKGGEGAAKTSLTLGTGSTFSRMLDGHGWNPNATNGFSLVTTGHAWHKSEGQNAMVSAADDVVVRSAGEGKTVVVHADVGNVSVAGQQKVVIGSGGNVHIAASSGATVEQVGYGEPCDSGVFTWVVRDLLADITKWAQVVKSLGELFGTWRRLKETPQAGKGEWETKTILSDLKVASLADLGGLVGDVATVLMGAPESGAVTIDGSAGIILNSGMSTAVFSTATTSISGGIGASVVGNVIASVHGAVGTTIASGVATTLRSLKDVEVRADMGELVAHARKQVTVSCEAGPLVLGGKTSAQLVSGGAAWLYGKDKALLSSGADAGWGVLASPDSVFMGKIQGGAAEHGRVQFRSPVIAIQDDDLVIAVNQDTELSFKKESSSVRLTGKKLSIEGKGNVDVQTQSGKILLG